MTAVAHADPWEPLVDPRSVPSRVDAAARQALGHFAADDPRRAAALATWLVARAALDGSTGLPLVQAAKALQGYGVADAGPGLDHACEVGRLLVLQAEQVAALPDLARAEEAAAQDVHRLLQRNAVKLVIGEPSQEDEAGPATLVRSAHRLDLPEAASVLSAAPADRGLVLAGDPAELHPSGPGRVFGDLAASGLVPVVNRPMPSSGGRHLGAAQEQIRAGQLPQLPQGQQELVVSPVPDAPAALRAARWVLTDLLPTLGVPREEVVVLTPRESGALGADALRGALADLDLVPVSTVHAAVGRRADAVVLVLPGEAAGSLSRALLVSALVAARRHACVVHQAGSALAQAVRSRPHRPRRTRLPALLRTAVAP